MDSLLTRAFDAAFGLPPEFCTACGGPTKNGPLVVVLEDSEDLGECEACRGSVDPRGRSIRRLGRAGHAMRVKVVHLVDSETDGLDKPALAGVES